MNDITRGWIAGLLEGEGCFSMCRASPMIALTMTDRDVVVRASEIFGGTKIYTSGRPKGHKTIYRTQLTGASRVHALLQEIKPLMSGRRTNQINKALRGATTLICRHKNAEQKAILVRTLNRKHGVSIIELASMCKTSYRNIWSIVQGKTRKLGILGHDHA